MQAACPSAPPGTELRHPGEGAQPDPDRREQNVEEEVPDHQDDPPEHPAPEWDARFRGGHRATCALASPARSSTTRMMRCAVSSIDSSEMSITGQRSRR